MTDADPTRHTPRDHDPDAFAAAWALGVLDADERAAAAAHLATCPACRAAVAEHEAVVGTIGASVAPAAPPAALRARLLRDIREPTPAPATPPASLPRRRAVTVALGLVAAIALVAVAVLALLLDRAIDERDAARYAEQEIAEYLRDGGTLAPLRPAPQAPPDVAAGHGALAVVPDGSQAMLVLYDLPRTTDDRRYLAWMDGDGERIDLGELEINAEGVGWLVFSGPEPMPAFETVGVDRVTGDGSAPDPFLVASIP